MFKIVDEPIDATALGEMVRTEADGAVCVFLGVARKFSRGREVVHLEYEAYPEMAEKKLAEIGDEIKVKFGAERRGDPAPHGRAEDRRGVGGIAIADAAPWRGVPGLPVRDRSAEADRADLEEGSLGDRRAVDRLGGPGAASRPRLPSDDLWARGASMPRILILHAEVGTGHTTAANGARRCLQAQAARRGAG